MPTLHINNFGDELIGGDKVYIKSIDFGMYKTIELTYDLVFGIPFEVIKPSYGKTIGLFNMNNTIQIKLNIESWKHNPNLPSLNKSLNISITDLDSNLLCEPFLAHKIVFEQKLKSIKDISSNSRRNESTFTYKQ